jgi:hypothetical protein
MILLAIVYAERMLPHDRRHPEGQADLTSPIVGSVSFGSLFRSESDDPDEISSRRPTENPAVHFVFDLKCPTDPKEQFDFRDSPLSLSVSAARKPRHSGNR